MTLSPGPRPTAPRTTARTSCAARATRHAATSDGRGQEHGRGHDREVHDVMAAGQGRAAGPVDGLADGARGVQEDYERRDEPERRERPQAEPRGPHRARGRRVHAAQVQRVGQEDRRSRREGERGERHSDRLRATARSSLRSSARSSSGRPPMSWASAT